MDGCMLTGLHSRCFVNKAIDNEFRHLPEIQQQNKFMNFSAQIPTPTSFYNHATIIIRPCCNTTPRPCHRPVFRNKNTWLSAIGAWHDSHNKSPFGFFYKKTWVFAFVTSKMCSAVGFWKRNFEHFLRNTVGTYSSPGAKVLSKPKRINFEPLILEFAIRFNEHTYLWNWKPALKGKQKRRSSYHERESVFWSRKRLSMMWENWNVTFLRMNFGLKFVLNRNWWFGLRDHSKNECLRAL